MITYGRGKATLLSILLLALVGYAGWVLFIPGPVQSNIAYIEGQIFTLHSPVDARVLNVTAIPGQTVDANTTLVELDRREWQAHHDTLIAQREQLQQQYLALQNALPHLKAISQTQLERYEHYQQTITLAKEAHQRQLKLGDFVSVTDKEDSAFKLAERQAMLHDSRHDYHLAQLQQQTNTSQQHLIKQALDDLERTIEHQQARQRDHTLHSPRAAYIHQIMTAPGSMAQKGQALLSYVPMDTLWLIAYFKETDLPRLNAGNRVQIRFDAYPEHAAYGIIRTVSQLAGAALSPQSPNYSAGNFTRIIQRIPIHIQLEPDSMARSQHLAIGLSATVTVIAE